MDKVLKKNKRTAEITPKPSATFFCPDDSFHKVFYGPAQLQDFFLRNAVPFHFGCLGRVVGAGSRDQTCRFSSSHKCSVGFRSRLLDGQGKTGIPTSWR